MVVVLSEDSNIERKRKDKKQERLGNY
jgi:hypothetical protein